MNKTASVDTYTNKCEDCGKKFKTTRQEDNVCEFCFPALLSPDKYGIGELAHLTNKIELVANKLASGLPLTQGETNLAKNILRNEVEKLVKKSKAGSEQPKLTDPKKVSHRRKVLRYKVKRQIEKLTEGME